MTRAQLSRIETGPPLRDLDKLTYLARALGIPAEHLWFDLPGQQRSRDRRPAPAPEFEPTTTIAVRVGRLSTAKAEAEKLDLYDLAVADLVGRYEAEGPQRLAREAVSFRRQVEELRQAGLPPQAHAKVLRLAGQLSGLLGYMAVNTGRFRLAELYCAEAFDLAACCGDAGLQAWVRGTQSLVDPACRQRRGAGAGTAG